MGIQWVEPRDVVKHPLMHRTESHDKKITCPQMSIVLRLKIPCLERL